MKKTTQRVFFFLIMLVDLAFSYYQHSQSKLDGDIANISLGYHDLMKDPFGISVVTDDKIYGGTNRYFAHLTLGTFFKSVPLFFQNFTNPIESIYLSNALGKILIQIFILWIFSFFVSGKKNILNFKFLTAAVLVLPLFQTYGYNNYMGIINKSVSYTFFYALPLGLLLLFFLPFYNAYLKHDQPRFSSSLFIFLFFYAIFLSFNGPLVPACVLLSCPLILLNLFLKEYKVNHSFSFIDRVLQSIKKIPKEYLILFSWISALSLYSIFIGKNNSENLWETIPLGERYERLPYGLFYLFTQKLGMPLLLGMIILNIYLVYRQKPNSEVIKISLELKWIGLFCIAYILLLPLGGYRGYRPNIVKSDTFMPILFCMVYVYGITSYFLINNLNYKAKWIYLPALTAFLIIFTMADISAKNENRCEKDALRKISQSPEKIIFLDNDCSVLSWKKFTDYKESELDGEMLFYWGVTSEKKLFYTR